MSTALVSAPRLDAGPILPRFRLVVVSSGAVYRRRRVAVAVVLVLLVVLAALAVGRAAAVLGGGPASVSGHRTGMSTYVVQPGDTLWSIAASVRPGADRARLIDVLARANSGADLWVGQRLVIP